MERLPISGEKILNSASYFLDLAKTPRDLSFDIGNSSNVDILLINLTDENNVHFEIADNSNLHIALFAKNSAQPHQRQRQEP